MSDILLANAGDPVLGQDALYGMFRLRHKVFYEQLGWEVDSRDGMERDGFDDLNPLYMVARHETRQVEGCWRFLPTIGPYMLKDTFPQLLFGEPPPRDPAVWELSRFAVSPIGANDYRQAALNAVTLSMIRRCYEFAVQHGIRHYVTVTSVALERLLKRGGLPIRRFGTGKAQRIGKVLSVACWVDVNEQFRAVVYPKHGTRNPWEAAA